MAVQYTLESTVVQQETGRAADVLFVPAEGLHIAGVPAGDDPFVALGLVRGVPITSVEDLEDVFFASLSGRVVPFDAGSFGRWRPRREGRSDSAPAVFAHQLATSDIVPVSSSPIRGTSLAKLLAHGSACTVSAAEAITYDPLRGLAVLVVSEVGIAAAQIIQAVGATAVVAIKWHMRRRLGIPPDWLPPEDRPR